MAEVVDRHRAQRARDPLAGRQQHVHLARGRGLGETSSAIAISSSVVWPRADRTATTRLPDSRWATIRRAACLIRSASATEVPPNFITTVSGTSAEGYLGRGACAPAPVRACTDRRERACAPRTAYTARRPTSARPSVSSSAYSRSAPTGSPLASRVTDSSGQPLAQAVGDVERGRLAGRGRVGRDHDLAHVRPPRTRTYSSAIFRSSGSIPSIGDSAPPSTW